MAENTINFSGSSNVYETEFHEDVEHSKNLLKKQNKFLLDKKQLFCDAVLIAGVDGKKIHVHRVVLSAASPYFLKLFSTVNSEFHVNVSPEIGDCENCKVKNYEFTITQISGNILEMIIQFCYTGTIKLQAKYVEDLMIAASMLQISYLVKFCSDFISKHLHTNNFLEIMDISNRLNVQSLSDNADSFLRSNFKKICMSKKFHQLSAAQLCSLIASDDLNVSSEEDVFHSVISWLDADAVNRAKCLPGLLTVIRMPLLSTKFINKYVKPVCDAHNCHNLYVNVLLNRLLPNDNNIKIGKNLLKLRKSQLFGNILAVGRIGNNWSILRYSTESDTWIIWKENFRTSADISDCCLYQSKLFMLDKNKLICIDLITDNEVLLPNFTQQRKFAKLAVFNNCIYVLGGCDVGNNNKYLNTVERWDTMTESWSNVANMNYGKRWFGTATKNGLLFVVGGKNEAGILAHTETFDPNTNKWTTWSNMLEKRTFPGVITNDNYIYVIGGIGTVDLLNTIERYNVQTNVWEKLSSLKYPRRGSSYAFVNERLYLVDSHDSSKSSLLNIMQIYDLEAEKWTQGAFLPDEFDEIYLFSINNQF